MEPGHPARWWMLAVLCLSVLLVTVDNTIVNVALPTLSRDLHASTTGLQCIVDAYTLVFSGLLLVGGNLGDRLGRRRVLQAGLALFALFSVGAALSRTTGELIVARAAMGAAAALIYPATLAILNNVFTSPRERATAVGVWSGVSGLAVAIGPVSGGALLKDFSWSSVFYVSIPVAVIALIAGRLLLPETQDPAAGRFDPVGALTSIAGISLLTYTIIEAPGRGWGSPATVAGCAAPFGLIGFFAWWQGGYWRQIIASMVLMAAGLAFTAGPATDAIMGALPPAKAGAGSAVNDTTRELGGTLGVAIVGSALNSAYGGRVASSLTRLGAAPATVSAAKQSLITGLGAAARFPAPARAAAVDGVRDAFMGGLHAGSVVAAVAAAAAALLALAFLPSSAPARDRVSVTR